MGYIVFGAGAVGGAIGGRLAQAGREVRLIARGAHLVALRESGLSLIAGDRVTRLAIPAFGTTAEAAPEAGDVVVLATKSQHTEQAVADLDELGIPGLAVVSAQNGVANERMIARRGFATYGQCVMLGATHLEPGVVELRTRGVLDLGRYPSGRDALAETVAADLREAGFESLAVPDIMGWKYAKLLGNLGNALDAVAGPGARRSDLYTRARAEAEATLAAAGIEYPSEAETRERFGEYRERPSTEASYVGSSSWQSLARGSGAIEADWLNGEIVLLGREYSVATPVNAVLRSLANRLARERALPGSVDLAEIQDRVAAFEATERGVGPDLVGT